MSEYCCFPKRNTSRFISNVYPVSQEMYAQMDIISYATNLLVIWLLKILGLATAYLLKRWLFKLGEVVEKV